jgi:multidrug efflux pump subunit AcrB
LWLGGSSLNVMSAIGLVVMLGIVVNDAILKIDTINQMRRNAVTGRDPSIHDMILEAGRIRLKAILMTSATTILALLPVLFSSGLGRDLQAPLALAVIGGLSVGTLLALFFVPLGYSLIQKQ